jgi:hypothetical protein
MALQFGHNVAVEYARVCLYRLYIYIYIYIGEKTRFYAITANRWRRFSKKSMWCLYGQERALCCKKKKQFVPLRPRDVAGVPRQACCYSMCHICLISQCVWIYNIVCGSIFGAEIEIVGVADPGTRNISLSM